jgi:YesN/AraC family two-component response regulator
MANVSDALQELGITEWVLRGNPTNADEFASMFRKVIGTTENNTAIESDNSTDWPEGLTWDAVEEKMNELTAAEPMKELRAERDRLIAATDWWASSDLTMTDAQTAYRQALRDITEDYSSLDDVEWPTKP